MTVRLILASLLLGGSRAAHAAFLPATPFTNDARGLTGAAFLKLPIGARPSALAESYTAAYGDPDAMFWNPAGLAWLREPELTASYDALLETAYTSAVAFGAPIAKGTLGMTALIHSQSPVDTYNSVGDPTGNFTPYDLAACAAWAGGSDKQAFGFGLKVLYQSLAGRTTLGWAVDLGWLTRDAGSIAGSPLDLGFAVRSLGAPVTVGPHADPLPLSLVGGLHWRARPDLSTFADAHLPVDDGPYLSVGEEWRAPLGEASLALRAGYSMKQRGQVTGLAGFSAGAGIDLKGLRADYAWVPLGPLGTTHRMTIGLRF